MTAKPPPNPLAFFASRPHPCGYLPGRDTVNLFTDPDAPMDMAIYSRLADFGFRRSGSHIYRPHCPQCQACLPVRIPVDAFQPSRAQRRTLKLNRDVQATQRPAAFDEEHFTLYRRYMTSRHPGGSMDDPDPERYLEFLSSPWSETLFVEFRLHERLMAVSVLDVLTQGLSAVYTFFDPELSARSPGRHGVLWAIGEAQRRGLDYLYLGYWIAASPKMRYKQEYRPLELLQQGQWRRFERGAALPVNPEPTEEGWRKK